MASVLLAAACGSSGPSTAGTAAPSVPGPSSPASRQLGVGPPVATIGSFGDLVVLRAWLAATLSQSASNPNQVHVQMVHTTLHAFEAAEDPANAGGAPTPVYGVQVTGSTFVCPCEAPQRITGPALRLTWDPRIHYVSRIDAGASIDLASLGAIFDVQVGHPDRPAPSGPQCGQVHTAPTIITTITRLDHTVNELPHVFTAPGDATPRMSAHDALRAVVASTRYQLAARVTATLARMTAPPYAVVPGSRLVWILTAPSVELVPNIGLPICGSANAIVDATTNANLLDIEEGNSPF